MDITHLPKPKTPRWTPRLRQIRTAYTHTLLTILRNNRILLATAVTLCPVIIPIALAFLSTGRFADNGYQIFIRIVEDMYLKAMAPLLALFFGTMLVGEDVEAQTISYLLTRPLSRTAWVIGSNLAYITITVFIFTIALILTFFASSALGGLFANREHLLLLLKYTGIGTAALITYGALCGYLGATTKHPVVAGVVIMFGWQRLALLVPGLVDFMTIEKYVMALLPDVNASRDVLVLKTVLADFQKEELPIDPGYALFVLSILTLTCILLTIYCIMKREYSSARALGS